MAISEKFKYYSGMLIQYITTRFGILKFAGFAVLLCFLGLTKIPEWRIFVENFIFIFASLFAFRLLDDVWSFYLDRIHHPARTYLLPQNIRKFIFFVGLVILVYLLGLFCFLRFLAITILILFLVSTVFYAVFFKVKSIMKIIPLVKYPVLIWCISGFSVGTEVLLLCAGAFFVMLTSDYIDGNKSTNTLKYKILLILITGILIFQPWTKGLGQITDVVFISITVLLIAFTSMDEQANFPVIVFPVLHIFDLIISL